jgi:hypothetical protein
MFLKKSSKKKFGNIYCHGGVKSKKFGKFSLVLSFELTNTSQNEDFLAG